MTADRPHIRWSGAEHAVETFFLEFFLDVDFHDDPVITGKIDPFQAQPLNISFPSMPICPPDDPCHNSIEFQFAVLDGDLYCPPPNLHTGKYFLISNRRQGVMFSIKNGLDQEGPVPGTINPDLQADKETVEHWSHFYCLQTK